MREDCVFCKIITGLIPVKPIIENEKAIVIHDKNPIAPEHVLVIAKEHFGSLGDLLPQDNESFLPQMFNLVDDIVARLGIANSGYRVVINTGDDAGQTVRHLHLHVIGGATLKNEFGA